MINIDELNRIREEKIERKKNTYETILKKCHNRIKYSQILIIIWVVVFFKYLNIFMDYHYMIRIHVLCI